MAGQRIEFRGSAKEYFGIWIVNLMLTIVTVGIYSAWAKVRRVRYFHGNTRILGDGLDYHADGWTILKGRLVIVAIIIAFNLLEQTTLPIQLAFFAVVMAFLPWAINKSLKFRARMTSWRNVRMNWHGGLWDAWKVFFLWPLTILPTFGLMLPFVSRKLREHVANHHSVGQTWFGAKTDLPPYYWAFFGSVAIALLVIAALIAIVVGAFLAVVGTTDVDQVLDNLPLLMSANVFSQIALVVILLIGFTAVRIYYWARTRDIIVNALHLDQSAHFASELSARRLVWIDISNFLAIVCTLGMLLPWAVVRRYKYIAEAITIYPAVSIEEFIDTAESAEGAIGEGAVDLEGLELGI